jgi:predicted  nucleic acid-binding Zn-ribbon protein
LALLSNLTSKDTQIAVLNNTLDTLRENNSQLTTQIDEYKASLTKLLETIGLKGGTLDDATRAISELISSNDRKVEELKKQEQLLKDKIDYLNTLYDEFFNEIMDRLSKSNKKLFNIKDMSKRILQKVNK